MIRSAAQAGLNAQEIPEGLLPETLLLSAAHHVSRGAVKICLPAGIKAKTSPFGGALDFRAAENVDDPLRAAAVLSIAMGLDEAA